MTKKPRTTITMRKPELLNIKETARRSEIRSTVRHMSGRAAVGATPRGSSGQRDQLKNTENTECFRNTLGCDHCSPPSTNGSLFDRCLEMLVSNRDSQCMFLDAATLRHWPDRAICRVLNCLSSKRPGRGKWDLVERDARGLYPSAAILRLRPRAGTRFAVLSGILPKRVRGGEL